MPDVFVVNASPLILLSLVDGLEWLTRLGGGHVLMPEAVLVEITVGDAGKKLARSLTTTEGFEVLPDIEVSRTIGTWDLGPGETQVLAVCRQTEGRRAVLDDRAARNCARSFGIEVVGTLGVVLIAKERGWILEARPVVEKLVDVGMYLSKNLIDAALAEVGE